MGVVLKLILILYILVLLPTVNAYDATITSQVLPSKSENVDFDQTLQFTITLTQSNTLCSCICTYSITGDVIGQSNGGFTLNPLPDKKIITFSKKAPHRGKSSEGITIDVKCTEPDTFIPYCFPSDKCIYNELITLNYDLPFVEKQAKQFLDINLIPLRAYPYRLK